MSNVNVINDGIKKDDKNILSFLMIGQSNMAGRGNITDVEPIINDKCYMLRNGKWQRMSEPINTDRAIFSGAFRSGISLAASFADELSNYMGTEIGLIPCADGGTSISQWQPGEILFDHAVMMTKLAMRTSKLGGIIWHQGESDCVNFDENVYRERFLNTMNGLRKELNADDLPIIIGELSYNITGRWNLGEEARQVNKLLNKLKDELPNCEIASSIGLNLKDDEMHFDAVSCREFGKRYFEKYVELTKDR